MDEIEKRMLEHLAKNPDLVGRMLNLTQAWHLFQLNRKISKRQGCLRAMRAAAADLIASIDNEMLALSIPDQNWDATTADRAEG